MAYTQLNPRHTRGARVEEISHELDHYQLSIPSGLSDSYRLAQLDDYTKKSRGRFPHRIPLSVSLLARTSSKSIPGTWGFGLWNDPFGLSLGFGGSPFRLPALPNAIWFFGASDQNYLSFRNPLASSPGSEINTPRSTTSRQEMPAHGFLAQVFRAPKFHPFLILAGLVLPFSRRMTRRLLSRVIDEDGSALYNQPSSAPIGTHESKFYSESVSVDPTQWHRYRLDWRKQRVSFEVDDVKVFESSVSPNPPLGLVLWIDNQYAAFTPEGKIGFGVLANPETAWLEVKEINLKTI